MRFNYKKYIFNLSFSVVFVLPVYADNIELNNLNGYNNNPNSLVAKRYYNHDVSFGEKPYHDYTSNLTSHIINPLGYRKGDWKKPIKWSSKYVKKGKYGDNVTIGVMDTAVSVCTQCVPFSCPDAKR